MQERSITDLSVAGRNHEIFELLFQHLPADIVLDFFEKASSWELRHTLADRLARNAQLVLQAVSLVPSLSDRSEQIARDCAERMFLSNTILFALIAQLERTGGPAVLEVEWRGTDHLRRARAEGRSVVVVAPHLGLFYAVPVVLSALGERPAVLGNVIAHDVLGPIAPTIAPRLWGQVEYVPVPSPSSAADALSVLTGGRPLVIFPEINEGASGNLRARTTQFLGRTIWVPTVIARFARIAGADIVSMTITPDGHRRVAVEICQPVPAPVDRRADATVSLDLFAWLERAILDRPSLWWGWPMLDTMMSVDAQPAAG